MLDLESTIAARYQGEARLQRLLWIAVHAMTTSTDTTTTTGSSSSTTNNNTGAQQQQQQQQLAQTALKMAHDYAMQEGNLRRYKEVFHLLQKVQQAPTQPSSTSTTTTTTTLTLTMDPQWVTEQGHQHRTARDVLYQRLHAAQAHLNKDAIRVAYLALAQHDHSIGELTEAFHSALRAKDFCTNRQQTAAVSLQILQTGLHLQNYQTVQEYTTRLSHTVLSTNTNTANNNNNNNSASSSPADAAIRYKVLLATGLERLAARDYKVAGRKFVEALYCVSGVTNAASGGGGDESNAAAAGGGGSSSCLADDSSGSNRTIGWSSVLAPDDVALYAIFLSLAQEDSSDALVALTEHPEAFELVPPAFEALLLFAQRASYQQAWCILQQSLFPALQLDLYMALHFDVLQQQIREKALAQYWRAYQRVPVSVLAAHMGPGILPLHLVEPILTDLIQRPDRGFPPDTRLDWQSPMSLVRVCGGGSRSLSSSDDDRWQQTQRKLNRMTHRVLDDTYSMMIRLACLEHGLTVVDPNAGARLSKSRSSRQRAAAGMNDSSAFAGSAAAAYTTASGAAAAGVVLMDNSDGEEEEEEEEENMMEHDAEMVDAAAVADIDEMNPEDLY